MSYPIDFDIRYEESFRLERYRTMRQHLEMNNRTHNDPVISYTSYIIQPYNGLIRFYYE